MPGGNGYFKYFTVVDNANLYPEGYHDQGLQTTISLDAGGGGVNIIAELWFFVPEMTPRPVVVKGEEQGTGTPQVVVRYPSTRFQEIYQLLLSGANLIQWDYAGPDDDPGYLNQAYLYCEREVQTTDAVRAETLARATRPRPQASGSVTPAG